MPEKKDPQKVYAAGMGGGMSRDSRHPRRWAKCSEAWAILADEGAGGNAFKGETDTVVSTPLESPERIPYPA